MQRKKIALFTNLLTMGGIGKVTFHLAQGFRACGVDVEVVVVKCEGDYLPLYKSHDIAIVDLKCKSGNAFAARELAHYLKTSRPDALIAMGILRNCIAIVAKYLSRSPAQIVITDHVAINYIDLNPKKTFMQKTAILAAYKVLALVLYRFADHLVAISRSIARHMHRYAWVSLSRIQTIYNPVVTNDTLESARLPVSHPWVNPKQTKVIIGVGRLHPVKDFPTLLRAFHIVRQQMECKLILLGDGPEKFNLLALAETLGIKEDLDIMGFVDNPYAYMSKADILVLPSKNEGLPTVLIEALACGCQIIATDCPGGTSEILLNGRCGTLVPVGGVAELADAMMAVLNGRTIVPREILLKRAEDFSVDEAVSHYKNLLGI